MGQPLWRTVWKFLKELKIELLYDPTISLLGVYCEKTLIHKDTRTPVFTTALLTKAKTWKQTECSFDEWIKKMWSIYTVEYYSALKSNERLLFAATWMVLEIIKLNDVSQTKTHTMWYMATHSSTLAWKIPWTEEPGRLQSMGSRRVGHDWATSLSLFTFMHCRRKWQPTPVFLPGESQGWRSLVGCCLWGRTVSDTTDVT